MSFDSSRKGKASQPVIAWPVRLAMQLPMQNPYLMGLCSANLSFIIAFPPSQPPSQPYDTSQHFSEPGAARFFSQKSISHVLQPDAYFVIQYTAVAGSWRLMGTLAFLKVEKIKKDICSLIWLI